MGSYDGPKSTIDVRFARSEFTDEELEALGYDTSKYILGIFGKMVPWDADLDDYPDAKPSLHTWNFDGKTVYAVPHEVKSHDHSEVLTKDNRRLTMCNGTIHVSKVKPRVTRYLRLAKVTGERLEKLREQNPSEYRRNVYEVVGRHKTQATAYDAKGEDEFLIRANGFLGRTGSIPSKGEVISQRWFRHSGDNVWVTFEPEFPDED